MIKLLMFAAGVFVGRSTLWPAIHSRDEKIGDARSNLASVTVPAQALITDVKRRIGQDPSRGMSVSAVKVAKLAAALESANE